MNQKGSSVSPVSKNNSDFKFSRTFFDVNGDIDSRFCSSRRGRSNALSIGPFMSQNVRNKKNTENHVPGSVVPKGVQIMDI